MGGILSSGLSFMVGENTKVHWRYTDSYIHNVLRQYPKNLNFENIERLPEAQQREYYIANNAKDIKEQLFIVGYEEEITMVATATLVLTLLLFAVRITSLRTVLLSIVCGGVLCLLLGLVLIFVLISDMFGTRDVYVVLAILWLTYLSMIALSIFSDKKQYRGIAMNISLFGFLPMTIVTLIAIWERYDWWYPSLNIEEVYYYFWYNIKELIVSIGGILLSLVFIGVYTSVIKRWKAMPE
jgi:putative membrane protein